MSDMQMDTFEKRRNLGRVKQAEGLVMEGTGTRNKSIDKSEIS